MATASPWKSDTVTLDVPVPAIGAPDTLLTQITVREPTAAMLEEIEKIGAANAELTVKVTIEVIALMSGLDRKQIAELSARDLLKVGRAVNPLLPSPLAAEAAPAKA